MNSDNVYQVDPLQHRHPEQPALAPMFLQRWSPRAMSGAAVSQQDLEVLLEAARWAPSSNNAQPWRFIYGHRDTPAWQPLFDLLRPGNQLWAHQAGVLILIIARTAFERDNGPSPTYAFDTGAAWMSLALQARALNLVAHGMRGFDAERATIQYQIPALYQVQAMVAVGHPGQIADLPAELQTREVPSQRKPLAALISNGQFVWD